MSSSSVAAVDFAPRRSAFRALHETGLFVLPNPWDAGSARYLASLGFAALATTSSGSAFTLGRTDGGLSVAETLVSIRQIVDATTLPVNADFEDGHAPDLDGLTDNVRACIDAGVAGLSIEDATGDRRAPLYPLAEAVDRIRAARQAIDASGTDVVLVGRAECFLTGHEAPLAEAIRRLVAFAEAGADCLYAPGLVHIEDIVAIVRAVAPRSVNVLLRPAPFPSFDELQQAGVRRVSVGGALSLAAWDGFAAAARALSDKTWSPAFSHVSHGSLNSLFTDA